MPAPLPRSRRGQLSLPLQGVEIILAYFNGEYQSISELTARAKKWADRYYQGYDYAVNISTALTERYPNVFNWDVQAHLRLVPAVMPETTNITEPEGASPRHLRRLERAAMNSEPFPQFMEPLIVTEEEIEQLINHSPRRALESKSTKTSVDGSMLWDSGLLGFLPEFLTQLAVLEFGHKTTAANTNSEISQVTDAATVRQGRNNNGLAALAEIQQRRNNRRLLQTGGNEEDAEAEGDAEADDENSGNGSNVSSSTVASLQANLKKRNARDGHDEDDEETCRPNKIRLCYYYPPNHLNYYDLKAGKWVVKRNPAAVPNDPFAGRAVPSRVPGAKAKPDPPRGALMNGSGPMVPIHTIKIRVPASSAGEAKVIALRDPKLLSSGAALPSPVSQSSAASDVASSSSGVKRIKVLPAGSWVNRSKATPASTASSSSSAKRVPRFKILPPGSRSTRSGSSGPGLTTGPTTSTSSNHSSGGNSGKIRIKLISRMGVGKLTRLNRKKKEPSPDYMAKVEEYLDSLH